jgi:hypothetical protein
MQMEHIFMNRPEVKVKSMLDNSEKVSVRTEVRCAELESTLVAGAERELLAFVSAVYELFGPEHARISVESWMQELESADWPPEQEIRIGDRYLSVLQLGLPPQWDQQFRRQATGYVSRDAAEQPDNTLPR